MSVIVTNPILLRRFFSIIVFYDPWNTTTIPTILWVDLWVSDGTFYQ